jgi:hypothetical protein
MKLIFRRVLIGSVCGTVASPFLCLAVGNIGLGVSLGALLGIAQIFAFFDLRGGSAIDRAMTCLSSGKSESGRYSWRWIRRSNYGGAS